MLREATKKVYFSGPATKALPPPPSLVAIGFFWTKISLKRFFFLYTISYILANNGEFGQIGLNTLRWELNNVDQSGHVSLVGIQYHVSLIHFVRP